MLWKLEDSEVKINVDSKAEKPISTQKKFTLIYMSSLLFRN